MEVFKGVGLVHNFLSYIKLKMSEKSSYKLISKFAIINILLYFLFFSCLILTKCVLFFIFSLSIVFAKLSLYHFRGCPVLLRPKGNLSHATLTILLSSILLMRLFHCFFPSSIHSLIFSTLHVLLILSLISLLKVFPQLSVVVPSFLLSPTVVWSLLC